MNEKGRRLGRGIAGIGLEVLVAVFSLHFRFLFFFVLPGSAFNGSSTSTSLLFFVFSLF